MRSRLPPVALLSLALTLCSSLVQADPASERFVLAWVPTRYDFAELALWQEPGTGNSPLSVKISGRGIDETVVLPVAGALRVPLPATARCLAGVDDCALVLESLSDGGRFHAVFQSPDTAGVPDTLLWSAHDTVRVMPPTAAGLEHVVLSFPNAPDFTEGATFASVIPVSGPTRVVTEGGCAGAVDLLLTPPDVLTLTCEEAGDDLTGVRIQTDAPSFVWSGNVVTQVPVMPGSGLSADLLMDCHPALDSLTAGSTWLVPPLPKPETRAGRGDLVLVVAGGEASVRVRDDALRDETRVLAPGDSWLLDTAGDGADRVLRIDALGSVACWQISKSWGLRGSGDGAAVPLVPQELWTQNDSFFLPDGYDAGATLLVVGLEGESVALDGQEVLAVTPAPGGGLWWSSQELPAPGRPGGSVHVLAGSGFFGAWVFGQGGYKAHALVAARGFPVGEPPELRRGSRPDALEFLVRPEFSHHEDGDAGPRWFYRLAGEFDLRLGRAEDVVLLDW